MASFFLFFLLFFDLFTEIEMNYSEVDAVLNSLTPTDLLVPISGSDKQPFKNIVELNDKKVRENHSNDTFIGVGIDSDNSGEQEGSDDSMDIDQKLSKAKARLHRRYLRGIRELSLMEDLTNVSNLAYWKASSFKTSNPIENVINDYPESYWQSDGSQPHIVDIYFSKRIELALLAVFFGFEIDESYSPKVVKLYVGDSISDLIYYEEWYIGKITQWYVKKFPSLEDREGEQNIPIRCHILRLVFPVNHDNGKDTHLRGVRIYTRDQNNRALSMISNNMSSAVKDTDRVLASIDPKSKFNDEYFTIR